MDSIKDIIPTVIRKMSAQSPDASKDIHSTWSKISGGTGTRVAGLKDGALSIHVDSAMRMVKLNLRKDDFIDDIKKDFPEVQRIYFKVAKV